MKKILIIAPHFPPSNLAAVHRSRLFAQHLPAFGWEPIILTVHEKHYEEKLDWNLHQLLPEGLRIEKVKAYPLTRPRLIGDIGLRAFFQLRKKALQLVRDEKVDFVYIPIPSFYTALIGPYLHKRTGVPYGIDYVDPWVHVFPGSEVFMSRHWWSTKLAKYLEPKAVREASLITGVAEGYYKGVQERNPQLKEHCLFGAMPYGGEKMDHEKIKTLNVQPYLFSKEKGKIKLVYAGAMLPKAYAPLERVFNSIRRHPEAFVDLEIHFIGTGSSPDDKAGFTIRTIAKEYGLWQISVFEYPARIPYLDVLIHLEASDGVFIIGSTEPHYTPSKVYQAVLSAKPILAVLHSESSAVRVINDSRSGVVLDFNGEEDLRKIEEVFAEKFACFRKFSSEFDSRNVDQGIMDQYSAKEVTKKLAGLVEKALEEVNC